MDAIYIVRTRNLLKKPPIMKDVAGMTFRTKQDQVAEIIRERIISGQYARGAKLKQQDLAEELGVSITPIREALHILVAEGFIESISHRGLMVPNVEIEKAKEILDLRIMLETDLTRRAVANLDRETLTAMRAGQKLIASLAVKGARLQSRTENYRFHFRLYERANRPQSLHFARILWAKYPFITQELGGRRLKHIDEHDVFLRFAAAGDVAAAVEAMAVHIQSGWNDLMASYKQRSEGQQHDQVLSGASQTSERS